MTSNNFLRHQTSSSYQPSTKYLAVSFPASSNIGYRILLGVLVLTDANPVFRWQSPPWLTEGIATIHKHRE